MIPRHSALIASIALLSVMTVWLSLVAVVARLRKQMLYVWLGSMIVFLGDLLHTIALSIRIHSGDPVGSITILGVPFEF